MKKLFSIFALSIFVFCSSVFAQSEVTPAISSGSAALLFQFEGFNTLRANNFNGGLGAKFYFTPALALRGSLQFMHANQDVPANPAPGQTANDGEIKGTRFGLSVAGEFHLSTGRVSPYVGGGVSFASSSTERQTPTVGNQQQITIKNDQNGENIDGQVFFGGTELGVFGIVGAEFFLFRELSLAAEYQIGFTNVSRSDQEVSQGNVTTTSPGGSTTGIGIESQGVFTLAFYF